MDDDNLATLQKLYGALETGDVETVVGLFAEEIVAHVPGKSPVAGDYRGRDATLVYVGKLATLSDGTFRLKCRGMAVGADGLAYGLVHDMAERGGRVLAINNVHVWRMAVGRFVELWIYPGDQYAWDAFWT